MKTIGKKIVGIIRGGDNDYDNSIQKGGEIIAHIFENLPKTWTIADILVDKDGVWHYNGTPILPAHLMHKVDVVWNAANPQFKNILENLSVPHVSPSAFFDLVKNNSLNLKSFGFQPPKRVVIPTYQKDFDGPLEFFLRKKAREILGRFGAPWIVRTHDKNMGIHIAKTFPELISALEDGVKHEESIYVEEFIAGREVNMHSVSGFRGEDVYVFPFGRFSHTEKENLEKIIRNLHLQINPDGYLNVKFILHPRRGVFLQSLTHHPDLKEGSDLDLVCDSVGARACHLLEHMLENALG